MTTAILLSDGIGAQLDSDTPKQYLPLAGKPIAMHCFRTLLQSPLISQIIVVCEKKYNSLFPKALCIGPEERRQDSIEKAVNYLGNEAKMVLIHDAICPLLTEEEIEALIEVGRTWGAAALATPLKGKIKQANDEHFVTHTLDPSCLYEIQTPEIFSADILIRGLKQAREKQITTNDDISLAELLGYPVKLVMGSCENIKIETPEDLFFAENICRERIPSYEMQV